MFADGKIENERIPTSYKISVPMMGGWSCEKPSRNVTKEQPEHDSVPNHSRSFSIVLHSLLNPRRPLPSESLQIIIGQLIELEIDVWTRHITTPLEARSSE